LDVGLGFHGDEFLSVMNCCNPPTVVQIQFAGEPIHIEPAYPVWDTGGPGLIAAAQRAPPDPIRSAFGLSVEIGAAGFRVRIAERSACILTGDLHTAQCFMATSREREGGVTGWHDACLFHQRGERQ
jgi:hypothetical protein